MRRLKQEFSYEEWREQRDEMDKSMDIRSLFMNHDRMDGVSVFDGDQNVREPITNLEGPFIATIDDAVAMPRDPVVLIDSADNSDADLNKEPHNAIDVRDDILDRYEPSQPSDNSELNREGPFIATIEDTVPVPHEPLVPINSDESLEQIGIYGNDNILISDEPTTAANDPITDREGPFVATIEDAVAIPRPLDTHIGNILNIQDVLDQPHHLDVGIQQFIGNKMDLSPVSDHQPTLETGPDAMQAGPPLLGDLSVMPVVNFSDGGEGF